MCEHSAVAGEGSLVLCWLGRAALKRWPRGSCRVCHRCSSFRGSGLTLPSHCSRTCRCSRKNGSVVPWIVFQVLAKSAKPVLVKTIAANPRHKTSWCWQLLELREGAELQAGQLPDLSVFSVADAGNVDVLDYINMEFCLARADACMECLGPRRGGHDALDIAVRSSSASCGCRRVRADLGAASRYAFRGISPSSASGCSQARRLDSLMLDDTIDARTIAAVCVERFDEIEGNARPAPAVWNLLVAALPAAPPAPANVDDAFDGDDGGLLSAQPAALLLAEPAPIVPTAGEEEIHGGQDNVDFPWTLCRQPLRKESHGCRLDFGFRVDGKFHAKCRKYRSYRVAACNNSVILFACTTFWVLGCAWQQHSTSAGTLARQMVRVYGVRCCSVVA